jgi:superfamily II DNA or RNA helicase
MITPYEYQRKHIDNIKNALKENPSILDTSSTGCGKTVTTLLIAKELNLRPLIICPKAMQDKWLSHSRNILGYEAVVMSTACLSFHKNNVTDYLCKYTYKGDRKKYYHSVCLGKYFTGTENGTQLSAKEIGRRLKEPRTEVKDILMVVDESQQAKNIDSLRSMCIGELIEFFISNSIHTRSRVMLLSATPFDSERCYELYLSYLGVVTKYKASLTTFTIPTIAYNDMMYYKTVLPIASELKQYVANVSEEQVKFCGKKSYYEFMKQVYQSTKDVLIFSMKSKHSDNISRNILIPGEEKSDNSIYHDDVDAITQILETFEKIPSTKTVIEEFMDTFTPGIYTLKKSDIESFIHDIIHRMLQHSNVVVFLSNPNDCFKFANTRKSHIYNNKKTRFACVKFMDDISRESSGNLLVTSVEYYTIGSHLNRIGNTCQVITTGYKMNRRASEMVISLSERTRFRPIARMAIRSLILNKKCKVIIMAHRLITIRSYIRIFHPYGVLSYYGEMKPEDRQRHLKLFQSNSTKFRVMIMNPQCGGMGIDLDDTTGAFPRVTYYFPNYDVIKQLQAEGRTCRATTQSKPHVYYIYSSKDYDKKMIDSVSEKREVVSISTCQDQNLSLPILNETYKSFQNSEKLVKNVHPPIYDNISKNFLLLRYRNNKWEWKSN